MTKFYLKILWEHQALFVYVKNLTNSTIDIMLSIKLYKVAKNASALFSLFNTFFKSFL